MGKRILILTPQFPYPPHQGTTMRNYNLIAQLSARHEIHLFSFIKNQGELDRVTPLREQCRSIYGVPLPRRTMLQRLITTLLSPLPDMALRLPSAALSRRLAFTLASEAFDVVQIEGIEMAPYGLQVARWRAARQSKRREDLAPLLVFDNHNAEYVLQQRAFETDVSKPRRWPAALYSFIQWHKLRHYEAQVCRTVDRVIAVSEADRAALQRLVPGLPVTVVPNGVDLAFYRTPTAAAEAPSLSPQALVFTGKMDFRPNIDAVLWFWQEVLPLVRQEVPDAHFYVVGQKPHPRLAPMNADPSVTVTGAVPDIRPYVAQATLYVVPLRMGGGTRFKLLEAIALGVPAVSTTLGCEGFPELVNGESIVIADTPSQFAQEVVRLLRDPQARRRLGEAGSRIAPLYDWATIVPRLEQVYEAR
jgi:sugar transferase (PEP-CTERM/EpsH1 system associated)